MPKIKGDSINWANPYPSQRSPVFARRVVATSQPLAAEAGIHALRQGGNAVDAAIATAITLTVVEPNNNGIGSDAFALIHDGKQLHGLNASGRSPAGLTPDRFANRNKIPPWTWDAVTVPGAVSAWVEMSSRFGRLPFESLFTDAIRHAREGFQVGPKSAFYWDLSVKKFSNRESFLSTFSIDGRAPSIGEVIKLPDHATTLEAIATTKGEAFYLGHLAEAIAADAARHGAAMTAVDLAQHQCDWVEPISLTAFGAELHEIPPNGQGLMALIALGLLKEVHNETNEIDSADSIHLQIEAQRIAYAETERHLADPDTMKVSVKELLDPERLKHRAKDISRHRANPHSVSIGDAADTVYLTTADSDGMMVSMIQSNFRGFGSGIVVPGTGISLQNRGAGFVLEPGHPNQVGPSKRPYHTIIPGFVTEQGQPSMSFGVMGGHMQAQGHLQMMLRVMHHGQNPQAALDAPRWYVFEDGRVALEAGTPAATIDSLLSRGHELVLDAHESLFGGGQIILKMADGYCAASEPRKEGLATGF